MIFLGMSLDGKLVPVQYREYEYGLIDHTALRALCFQEAPDKKSHVIHHICSLQTKRGSMSSQAQANQTKECGYPKQESTIQPSTANEQFTTPTTGSGQKHEPPQAKIQTKKPARRRR